MATPSVVFQRQRHIGFFAYILKSAPARMTTLDTNRMMIVYFCCSALDILGALDDEAFIDKKAVVDWILRMQVLPTHGDGAAWAKGASRTSEGEVAEEEDSVDSVEGGSD
jgi:hypothetical protein